MKRIIIVGYIFIFHAQTYTSQVVQQEIAQNAQATPLELQMIYAGLAGTLTEKKLQQYLKQGADINAKDDNGFTALLWASTNGHTAVVQQLIAAHADINAKNNYGLTALLWASTNGHTAIAQQLIAAGANINAKDNDDYTALIWASIAGHTAIAQQLIAAGADINAKSNYGRTALISASDNGHTAIVQQLIAAGADQTIANEKDNNKTARDYASDGAAYEKAVAAGLQERKEYLARQPKAKQFVAEQTTHIPGLQDIIMGYAYGQSPSDLPPLKPEEEKKSDSEAVLETSNNREKKKSNCVIQ